MGISTGSLRFPRPLLAAATVVALLVAPVVPAAAAPGGGPHWVGTWAMPMQPATDIFGPTWSLTGFDNHTVRQVIRVSAGGSQVRIRLSNVDGTVPLRVAGATVAKAGEGASVLPGTVRRLTFGHAASVTIPVGLERTSDTTAFAVGPLDRLTISLYLAEPTGPATFHGFASATSYRATGDHRFDRDATAFTESNGSYYFLTAVDVAGPPARPRGAVVTFGDSITDGALSTVDADNRYPDELAERLVAANRPLSVLNAGLSGNRVLEDSACFGDAPAARFARDVLNQSGVRTVIVKEATNDIIAVAQTEPSPCGSPRPDLTVDELIDAHRAMIQAAHARGIKIIGGTILPYKGGPFPVFTERGEQIRDELNHWIRTSGEYDAVVDFERAVADPADPDVIRADFDSGDGIHPNDDGYRAMAAAIDLDAL